MANKRQRKKQLKKLGQWEGQQYRGGRQPGRSNLQKNAGGTVTNKHGVTFTEQQKKDLERSVARSNYIRKKQTAEVDKLNPQHNQLRLMGKQSDYILSRQSKSLQRFKSMEEYTAYMDKQARIQSGDYMADKARLYKRNFTSSLLETYGDDAKDIAMKIRMMKPEEYMKKVAENEELEISYTPSKQKREGRLNQLRAALGMKLKEEWGDEEQEE